MDKEPDSECNGLTSNQTLCVSRSKKTLPLHDFPSHVTISLPKTSYPKQYIIKKVRTTQQLQEKHTQQTQTHFTHSSSVIDKQQHLKIV